MPSRSPRSMTLALTTAIALVSGAALAHAAAKADARGGNPVAVELFTSQSCSSCPPAEALLRTLADRPDIVALEWHVDYWDSYKYGEAGSWKDPFSSKAYTARQRQYNQNIRGKSAVYTPQAVIGGRAQVVGSHKQDIINGIARLRGAGKAEIAFDRQDDGAPTVTVSGDRPGTPADIVLVRFLKSAQTQVPRGENHGKTLANAHVVVGFETLGRWTGGKGAPQRLPQRAAKEGCAVLVQAENQGRILAAQYCPR